MSAAAMKSPEVAESREPGPDDGDLGTVVSLVEEKVDITTREIVTGRVRVSTTTDTVDHVVKEDLHGTRVDVTRVPIGRTLDPGEAPAGPRTEAEVTIIPIFEEVVVVEKRLVLKEELHITRHRIVELVDIPVVLRKQQAIVERLDTQGSSRNGNDTSGR